MDLGLRINPRQLEAFQAVMVAGNMTAAASVLGVTQPAVSRLIRDLEASLGLRLFDREGNHLLPSREGVVLYSEVDKIFRNIDHIAIVAQELRNARLGTLRIASVVALSLTCIPAVLQEFQKGRPSVVTSLKSFDSRVVVELVAQHHFDIGFAQAARSPNSDVSVKPLPSVEAVCILPAWSPLREKPVITPKDIEGNVFISLGERGSLRLKTDAVLREHGVRNVRYIETSLAASAKALVSRGMGMAIVDPFTAWSGQDQSLAIRRFEPTITYEASIIYPKYRGRSRLAGEFGKLVAEHFNAFDPLLPAAAS